MYCVKGNIAVLQTKISLPRKEGETSCKFLYSSIHLFQISNFYTQFKITTVGNIDTIDKRNYVAI